jgi:hypothetical protein
MDRVTEKIGCGAHSWVDMERRIKEVVGKVVDL